MRLLDFVALYGLMLMPMGVVIFADFYLLPRLGLKPEFAESAGVAVNWAAGVSWLLTLALLFLLPLELFFKGLPGFFLVLALYLPLSLLQQKLHARGILPAEVAR